MKTKITSIRLSGFGKKYQTRTFCSAAKKLLLLPILLFAMISCETGDSSSSTTHIYAVGNNGGNEAYLTKDGVTTSLGVGYFVNDVFVVGNNVYTCGQKDFKPAYTINGIFTILDDTAYNSAYKIFVNNGDIYVVGVKDNYPVYWKNGVLSILNTPSGFNGVAYDITINNNDVYIAGYQYQVGNSGINVLYWKNGIPTTVNSSHNFSGGFIGEISIAVDANDVYLAVNERNDTGVFNSNAYLIKNGNEETLVENNSEVHDIFISGSDLYLCGSHITEAGIPNKSVVWKNGTSVVEKDVEHGAFISLSVASNNIFAVGVESNLVSSDPPPFGTRENHATTLINNVFEIVPDFGTPGYGTGYMSVFVTE